MSFGQVLHPGEPLPDPAENKFVWSGYVEIRKNAKTGTVSYTAKLAYEKGDDRVKELFGEHVKEFVKHLPDRLSA